ncbi:MAG: hypothetical protein IBX68_11225 [Dehalococcoidia bacterium]|nr:hypothetical protein [Dehalococcoidia bacterium]
MIVLVAKDRADFFDVYYEPQGQVLAPVTFYHEQYYRSMGARLYNFGGEEWVPLESTVISWEERNLLDTQGNRVRAKVITDQKTFSTYEQALAFLEDHSNFRIAGSNRFLSPVPLEKLEHYEVVYKSPTTVLSRGEDTISRVEVFEYRGGE